VLLNAPSISIKTPKGGRTRADKIGVGAGGDIGCTDISCIFMARQYMGSTRRSYWDDHRHVGVTPVTPSLNTRKPRAAGDSRPVEATARGGQVD